MGFARALAGAAVVALGSSLLAVMPDVTPARADICINCGGGGGGTSTVHAFVAIDLQAIGGTVSGGSVAGGDLPSSCAADCLDSVTSTSDAEDPVTYTATPASGWAFDHWSGCTSTSGSSCTLHPTYTLTSTQTAGNTSSITAYFRDSTPPTVTWASGSTADNAYVGYWSPTYNFTFDGTGSAASVQCGIDTARGSCTSATKYTFSGGSVPEGTHTVVVYVTDAGNNVTAITRHFTEDRTAPTLTVTQGPATGSWQSSNQAVYSFSSTDANAVTFRCLLDNASHQCTAQSATAPWIGGDKLTGLTDGTHTWEVEALDPAGNGRFTTRSFGVDTESPAATFTDGPAEGSATNDTSPSFAFTLDGTGSTPSATCQVDSGTPAACTSSSTEDIAGPLADGSHSLTLHVVDQAGNTATVTRSFTVDTTVPTLSVTAGPAAYVASGSATFGFSANGAATVTCSLDGEPFRACSTSTSDQLSSLGDGSHTWQVQAANAAGTTTTVSRAFTVDTVLPTASFLTGPADGSATNDAGPTFTFSTDGTGSTASVLCRLDDQQDQACTTGTSEALTGLPDGAHTLSVDVTDQAGNTASFSRAFTVDTVGPALPLYYGPADGTATAASSVVFAFSTEWGATLACSLDGEDFRQCSGTGDDALSGLADGPHSWQVRSADPATNVTTDTVDFVVDTLAPSGVFTGGPGAGGFTNQRDPQFTFALDGTGTPATANCAVDAATPGACTTATTYQPSGLADGQHTVTVTIDDAAGNTTAISQTFTVDTNPPTAQVLSGPSVTRSTTVTFGFSTENGASAACALDGEAWRLCSGTGADTLTGLSEAKHTWHVRATDEAGNTTTLSRTFTVDHTNPSLTVTGPTSWVTKATSATVTWKVSDTLSGVASSDVRYQRAHYNGGFGSWTSPRGWLATKATKASLAVARGYTYCFEVRVRDKAGNTTNWSHPKCTAVALDDRSLSASSGWSRATTRGDYAGTSTTTTRSGVALTLKSVQAKRVSLLATTCSTCGSVNVYLGSTRLKSLSLHSSSTHRQVLLRVASWSSLHKGTITIRTTTGKRVEIDGLALSRT